MCNMEHIKTGLVLEGGGMRGIYTAGVLDVFLDQNMMFDGVIGVSAGAIHGCSFVSRQKGRSIVITRSISFSSPCLLFSSLSLSLSLSLSFFSQTT